MIYRGKATVNYPETEVDTPDFEAHGFVELVRWMQRLVAEPDATSFVITFTKSKSPD